MLGYILRRILWMIPTFLGILLLNFGILRLQSPSLSEEMDQGGGAAGGSAGDRDARGQRKPVENALVKLRMTGRDLPALLNTRGFLDRDDVLDLLRRIEGGERALPPSQRRALENDLWLCGRFAAEPLAQILADPALDRFHAPAAMALSLCAYVPLIPGDEERWTEAEREALRNRNKQLTDSRISYRNDNAQGYVATEDPASIASKRQHLIDLIAADPGRFRISAGQAWGAFFAETGLVDFFGKLLTLNLYSETKRENVFTLIGERWWRTFGLTLLSVLIAWGVSLPLGIRSARRIDTLEDRVTTAVLFGAWSLPSFFVGTVLLMHLCTDSLVGWRIFPNKGLQSTDALWYNGIEVLADAAWHWFLPLVVLSYASFTALSRYMRGNMLDNLRADYVRTARAKGCSEDRVVYGHVLRNSLITMITLGSGLLAELFGGFTIVEKIFSIEGLGLLMLEGSRNFDAPLVMGSVVISVLLLLVSILVADILYAVADPRLRGRYG